MTAFDFSLVKNTSFAFDATADSLNLGAIDASSLSVGSDANGNLVITSGSDSVTLEGATAGQVTTSNMLFGTATDRSFWVVGDNETGTTSDITGNTINLTDASIIANTSDDANHLVYGFGGNDAITVEDGNNLVFGGTGAVDSTDGADAIVLGSGANTVYGNAGNDVITFGTVTASGNTVMGYLGLGNDNYTSGAAAGNLVLAGNSGADTLTLTNMTGDATVYGGNGIVDATDDGDTFALGQGNQTIYANSGDDTVTMDNLDAGKTLNLYLGVGNDSLTGAATADATATANIYGNTGDDVLNFAAFDGDATIFGGNGTVDTSDGADTITSGTNSSTIYGNAGNDSITLSAVGAADDNVSVFAGADDDTIVSTANHTALADISLAGNGGNNVYQIDASSNADFLITDFTTDDIAQVTFTGGAAAVIVSNMGIAPELLIDGGGTANVYDNAADERIVFSGFSGDFNGTILDFGAGNGDLLTNFSGTAGSLTGNAGEADQLISGTTGDTLTGGETVAAAAYDKYEGNEGDDTIQLDDLVATDLNNGTTIAGGAGTDTLEVTGDGAVTLVNADFTADITSVEVLKLSNVTGHSVTLGAGAVTAGLTTIDVTGMTTATNAVTVDDDSAFASALTYSGGSGVDTVTRDTAADQNDNIALGSANDTLTMVTAIITSNDTIDGGAGNDTLTITDAISLTDADFTNITNLETIVGGDNDGQTLVLGAEASESGLSLVDLSAATTGGNDASVDASSMTTGLSIIGAVDGDTLTGGSGNDTLNGGGAAAADDDQLTGGDGDNEFRINQLTADDVSDILDFTNAGSTNSLTFNAAVLGALGISNESLDTEAGVDGGDDDDTIVVVTDQSYNDYDAAYAALDASTNNSGGEWIVGFLDADDSIMTFYYDVDNNDNANEVLIATIQDINTLAELTAEFTGGTTSINEIATFA